MGSPVFASYQSAIILDASTGYVLHAENADQPSYPASLTKMMTLYMTFDALDKGLLKKDQQLVISQKAASQPASKLGLRAGDKMSVEKAILALVTKSANDVATVLSENLATSEKDFADMMTQVAKELGMKSTLFKNASGLGNQTQISTARDMAILALGLLKHFPQHYHYFSTRSFTYQGKKFYTHNHILDMYPGADGFKTGYIRASGYNLVASAHKTNQRVIGVLLGGNSAAGRDKEMAYLLDYGFLKLKEGGTKMAQKSPTYSTWKQASSVEEKTEQHAYMISDVPVVDKEKWGIQIGAFTSKEAAYKTANMTQHRFSLLENAKPFVMKIDQNGRALYRSRLMDLNKIQAHQACDSLQAHGTDCFIVKPRG